MENEIKEKELQIDYLKSKILLLEKQIKIIKEDKKHRLTIYKEGTYQYNKDIFFGKYATYDRFVFSQIEVIINRDDKSIIINEL